MDQPNTWQGFKLGTPANYRIRVQGHLDRTWTARLEGMAIKPDMSAGPNVTILEGYVFDQAALSGVLNTLYETIRMCCSMSFHHRSRRLSLTFHHHLLIVSNRHRDHEIGMIVPQNDRGTLIDDTDAIEAHAQGPGEMLAVYEHVVLS